MQYFAVYVDGMKDLYIYSDKNNEYEIGDNVIVPFRGSKKSAFIIKEKLNENFNFKVMNILSKIENSMKLSSKQLELIEWIVNYYICSYDSVINTIFPKKVKIKYANIYQINWENLFEQNYFNNKVVEYIVSLSALTSTTLKAKFKKKLFDDLVNNNFLIEKEDKKYFLNLKNILILKNNQTEVFEYFNSRMLIKKDKLKKLFPKENFKDLEDKKILEIVINISNSNNNSKETIEEVFKNKNILNSEQFEVKEKIEKSNKKYFLLKGVTGSGKTEIYIEIIKNAFFRGEGCIFLVPEISLTPQMMKRFKNEFKNNIAILHSLMTDSERAMEWEAIYKGKKKIVLGVRSAIFSPVQNLKYIILDEEHETTYKQDSSPRYNAKYIAIKRCLLEDAKLILGSATPSIESYFYAKQGIYELLTLDKRHGNSEMPDIVIVDMKHEESTFFSKKLLNEIKNTLLKNEQVILFLNRKGYSTHVQCKKCGYVEECRNCSIKMSYYNSKKEYKCNYCDSHKPYSGKCSNCGSEELIHSGKGIERIEEELKKFFDTKIIKADANLAKNKNYLKNLYEDFLNKKYDILIGTQIITKGLHFPDVTLVGVINADSSLNFPDFRSSEKTFQLLTQVSGRAGRDTKKGKVIIQTYDPENTIIRDSKEENYNIFYDREIEARKIFHYPPFTKIVNIGFSSEDEKKLWEISNKIFNELNIKNDKLEFYGPMPSLVYKVKNRFRVNIFIKGIKNNIDNFKIKLKKILLEYKDTKVRLTIDVDAVNLM